MRSTEPFDNLDERKVAISSVSYNTSHSLLFVTSGFKKNLKFKKQIEHLLEAGAHAQSEGLDQFPGVQVASLEAAVGQSEEGRFCVTGIGGNPGLQITWELLQYYRKKYTYSFPYSISIVYSNFAIIFRIKNVKLKKYECTYV